MCVKHRIECAQTAAAAAAGLAAAAVTRTTARTRA